MKKLLNLDRGITQFTPPENSATIIDAARKHSHQYRTI